MRKGFMERSLLLRQSSTLGGSRAESGGGLVWRSREKAQKGNWFLRAPGILCGHWREAGAAHRGWLKPESTVNRENAPDKEKAPGFKNPLGMWEKGEPVVLLLWGMMSSQRENRPSRPEPELTALQ